MAASRKKAVKKVIGKPSRRQQAVDEEESRPIPGKRTWEPIDPIPKADRPMWVERVCKLLESGECDSLTSACLKLRPTGGPSPDIVLSWTRMDDALLARYTEARNRGYKMSFEKIADISSENFATIVKHRLDEDGKPMFDQWGDPITDETTTALTPEAITRNRLRIESLKWILSKALPRLYGERITTEHVGPNDGPLSVTMATMTSGLKGLDDKELAVLNELLAKAASAK